MNNPMTNRIEAVTIGRSLLLSFALLISACDGGIFGTGGPDDIEINASGNADASQTDSESQVTQGSSQEENGESNLSTSGGSSESGQNNNGGIDGADAGNGGTDSGAGTDSGDGATDSSTDGDTQTSGTPPDQSRMFLNNQPTLDSLDARINAINTTALTINVIDTGAPTTPTLFGATGVASNTISSSTKLETNETSLEIIDNTLGTETLFSFSPFTANEATFSTLLIRDNGSQIDVIPLITMTTVSDVTLAKVRIVQAVTLGELSAQATFDLQSAGLNPGGIDQSFGPLSYNNPVSNYIDIPNGDYELIDSLGRIDNQMLNFIGGNVYTLVIVENNTGATLLVNDTEAAEL